MIKMKRLFSLCTALLVPMMAWGCASIIEGKTGLPRLLRTPLNLFRHCFKRLRTYTAKMAVSTGAIIEHLDVIVDLGIGDSTSLVDSLLDPLLFHATNERLGHGVIPAVSPPAHTGRTMMRMAESAATHRCHIASLDLNESGCAVACVAARP